MHRRHGSTSFVRFDSRFDDTIMQTFRSLLALAALALIAGPATTASASPPSEIPIQAYLTDDQGQPIGDSVDVRISLYASQSGGSPIHRETFEVTPDQGTFTAYLGTNKPLDLKTFRKHDSLYVGLRVGDDPEMTPRLRLATAPYAASAAHARRAETARTAEEAKTLQGKKPSDFASADYRPSWKDVQNRPSGRCKSGETMMGLKSDGSPVCANYQPTWADIQNRPSGRCKSGETMMGLKPDGSPVCANYQPTWTDVQNRPSGRCKPDHTMVGLKSNGSPICRASKTSKAGEGLVKTNGSTLKLEKGGVQKDHIGSRQVTQQKIAPKSVRGGVDTPLSDNEIVDGTITGADLAGDSIGAGALQTNSIDSSHLSNNAVVGGQNAGNVKNGTITGWDVKNDSLGHHEIEKGAVRSNEIEDGTIQPSDMSWKGCGYYVYKNDYTHIFPNASSANKLPNCKNVPRGSFCQADGECGIGNDIDNVGTADVLIRVQ